MRSNIRQWLLKQKNNLNRNISSLWSKILKGFRRIKNRRFVIDFSLPNFVIGLIALSVAVTALLQVSFPASYKSWIGNLPGQEKYDPKLDLGKVNYNHLNNLLTDKKYQAANEETNRIIIEDILEEPPNYKAISRIKIREKLKRRDILIMDKLWNKHSLDNYGLNVQSCLWASIDNEYPGEENIERLFNDIGWVKNNSLLNISQMKFEQEEQTRGYLPRLSLTLESHKVFIDILNDYTDTSEKKCNKLG